MKLDGERTFAAPRTLVWEVLNDPKQMAEVMPGVESFDVEDDRHWRVHVKIPLGLGGLRLSINFEKTEEREPDFARLRELKRKMGRSTTAALTELLPFSLNDYWELSELRERVTKKAPSKTA